MIDDFWDSILYRVPTALYLVEAADYDPKTQWVYVVVRKQGTREYWRILPETLQNLGCNPARGDWIVGVQIGWFLIPIGYSLD